MNDDARTNKAAIADGGGETTTTPAERALSEAAERRAKSEQGEAAAAREINGPKGLEPTRYGDWEKRGIASDF